MSGAIPSLPKYVFMTWCLVKYRDDFSFFTFRRRLGTGRDLFEAIIAIFP
jgi:hypothetical protein